MSQSASSRKHYLNNRAARIADKKARKVRNREFIQEYKRTHPCIRCGESDAVCLDFHHRDPVKKFIEVSLMGNRGYGQEKILTEITKCDILCANCHRKFHRGLLV